MAEAAAQAKEAFEFVLAHGTRIVYDHHIVYWTRTYLAFCASTSTYLETQTMNSES
jgi:hypothetical protein